MGCGIGQPGHSLLTDIDALWLVVDQNDLENPFHRTGTDDARRIGAERPVAPVGLAHHAHQALARQDKLQFKRSYHVLLAAPYGAGKSAAIRRLSRLCRASGGYPSVVKLEQEKLKSALMSGDAALCAQEIIKSALHDIATQIAKNKHNSKSRTSFDDLESLIRSKLISHLEGIPISRTFAKLAKSLHKDYGAGGVVLLDEAEALIAYDAAPITHRLQLLEILKNWCEETDSFLSLVVAGTTAVLDIIRELAPKVIDGRLVPLVDYALDEDDVETYLVDVMTNGSQFAELGDLLGPEAIPWVASASRGVPREIERLCYLAWELARDRRSEVDLECLREATAMLVGSQLIYSIADMHLAPLERRAVKKLARNGLSTAICRDQFTNPEMKALRRAYLRPSQSLIEHPRRGEYRISDFVLRDALRRGQ